METPPQPPPPPPPPPPGTGVGSIPSAGSGGSSGAGASTVSKGQGHLGHSAPLVTIASPSGIAKPLVSAPPPPAAVPAPPGGGATYQQQPPMQHQAPQPHATIAQPPPMYAPQQQHQQPAYTVVAGDSVTSVPYPTAAGTTGVAPAAPAPAPTPTVVAPPPVPGGSTFAVAPPPPPPPPPPAAVGAAAGAPPVAQRVIRAASSPALPRRLSGGGHAPKSVSSPGAPAAIATGAVPVVSTKKKLKSLEEEADAFLLGPITDHRGRVVQSSGGGSSSAERKKKLKPPKLPDTSSALHRVRSLVVRRAYVDVLAVTSDLLQSSSTEWSRWYSYLISGAPPGGEKFFVDAERDPHQRRVRLEAAELLRLRMSAMMRLRRYADVSAEVERLNLGENDESRGTLPPWVPRDLRVMAAASGMYADGGRGAQRCVDGLHRMREEMLEAHRERAKRKDDGEEERGEKTGVEWLGRVDAALSNAFVRQSEWRLALTSLDDVLGDLDDRGGLDLAVSRCLAGRANPFADPADGARESRCLRAALGAAARIEVRSRQGRILLQSGGCDEAEDAFAMASDEVAGLHAALEEAEVVFARGGAGDDGGGAPESKEDGDENDNAPLRAVDSDLVRNAPTQVLINDGLLLFSRQRHGEAFDCFLGAMDAQREEDERRRSLLPNGSDAAPSCASSPSDLFAETLGIDSDPTLLAPAVNDAALCALYTCRMRDAVAMMESLVRESPSKYLTERMAFNLATLYELGSDGATSERRKRVLQAVAKRFFLHDVGSECFRIN